MDGAPSAPFAGCECSGPSFFASVSFSQKEMLKQNLILQICKA